MKKVLLSAFTLVSLTQAANAQKRSLLVGGDVRLETTRTSSTPNDYKRRKFDFNPTVGYQFADNWTAGAVARIGTNKGTSQDNLVDKSSNIGVGPFVRYSRKLSNVFSVYGQLQGVFGTYKINGKKASSFATVNALPAVFINGKKGFGLNFSFGGIEYTSYKQQAAK